jgi:hypothetical protein
MLLLFEYGDYVGEPKMHFLMMIGLKRQVSKCSMGGGTPDNTAFRQTTNSDGDSARRHRRAFPGRWLNAIQALPDIRNILSDFIASNPMFAARRIDDYSCTSRLFGCNDPIISNIGPDMNYFCSQFSHSRIDTTFFCLETFT